MPEMNSSLSKWWLSACLLGVLTGCGKPMNKSDLPDLPGTYVVDYGFATDTVTIKDNGQFIQNIKIKTSGKVAVTNGTWRFEPDRDIYFSEEFMNVINGFNEMVTNFDNPTHKGISILPVRRRFGKLEIGGDGGLWLWGRSGVDTPYKKQASQPPK